MLSLLHISYAKKSRQTVPCIQSFLNIPEYKYSCTQKKQQMKRRLNLLTKEKTKITGNNKSVNVASEKHGDRYDDFPELRNATGKLEYSMLNDCLFKLVFQSNEKVLKGFLCSLLHLKPEEIISIEVLNPYTLGTSINDKTFILDLKIMLNRNKIVNIELQVENGKNWPERSLLYTSRTFDNLNKGDEYEKVKPVQHIGILDFDIDGFPPEFYSKYMLMNVRNHNIYTGKFVMNVLDLRQLDIATDEDKLWEIDYWAKLFKATTWEEIKMLAEKDETMYSAAKSIYEVMAEYEAQLELEARQRYIRKEKRYEEMEIELAEKDKKLAKKDEKLAEKDKKLAKKDEKLAQSQRELLQKDEEIASLKTKLEAALAKEN